MGKITLNKDSDGVTTSANVVNVFSDAFKAKVQASVNIRVFNGTPIRMKLHDSSDAELPNSTELLFGYRIPGEKQLHELWKPSYQPFANIATADQYNADTEARRVLKIPSRILRLTEDRELVLQVKSSVAIDWTKSFIEIDVQELVV